MHEASCHEYNEFVTLTYDDEHVPYGHDLVHADFQKFMKRLRRKKSIFDVRNWNWSPRFYMCGEYGEERARPHFHALLFGVRFNDRKHYKNSADGSRIYQSKELEELWGKGMCTTGDVTWQSASYVSRYVMKKVTGERAREIYSVMVPDTGEEIQRESEYNRASLKPAIGKTWFEKWTKDCFPRDEIVMNGMKMKPPRYYDKLLQATDAATAEMIEFQRYEKGRRFSGDATPERLAVREAVVRARMNLKKRGLA